MKVGRLDAPRTIRMDTAAPPEIGPGDVLIKVACTGICGTDLGFYREGAPVAGAVLGHEFAGEVVAVGDAVSGVLEGERVVANPMVDFLGLGRLQGSFAEYLRLPNAQKGRNLFTIPETVSDEVGALIEPFAVGLHAVNRSGAGVQSKVAVYGAGPIGLCVVAGLRAKGVERVLAIDPSSKRRELALAMGATAVFDPTAGSASAFIAEHFGGETLTYTSKPIGHADVVLDCAGVEPALDDALHSLRAGGRLVLVADPHHAVLPSLRLVMMRELEVTGALAYEDEFVAAIRLVVDGKVDLAPLVSHRFALDELAQAFETQMDAQNTIKVLVRP